jgi:translation initiation factor IF-2
VPIRIYALAKELKIDSKELVEICNRAGITGKGSALASLDDDELARVKAFMSGPKTPAAKAQPSSSSTATSEPAPPTPASAEPSDSSSYTRDDYIPAAGNVGSAGKMRVLGGKPKAKGTETLEKPERPKQSKPRTPVIHVAQMPEVKQPPPATKADEPAPQKPDIRLPQDAIASAKMGTRPPLEHLTAKAEKKKKDKDKDKEKDKEKEKVKPERVVAYTEEEERAARGRGKRGERGDKDVDHTLAIPASV